MLNRFCCLLALGARLQCINKERNPSELRWLEELDQDQEALSSIPANSNFFLENVQFKGGRCDRFAVARVFSVLRQNNSFLAILGNFLPFVLAQWIRE